MPFWRKEPNPELDAARTEAEGALPPGWEIHAVDPESFRVPAGKILTYGISAYGPAGEKALVVAVGKVNAYRQLTRLLHGELDPTESWGVPLGPPERKEKQAIGVVWDDEDPEVIAARSALEAGLPSGWSVFFTDREKFRFPDGHLKVFAVSVAGPAGEGELVLGLNEAHAYEQMIRRLRGELETSEGWAPTLDTFTHVSK